MNCEKDYFSEHGFLERSLEVDGTLCDDSLARGYTLQHRVPLLISLAQRYRRGAESPSGFFEKYIVFVADTHDCVLGYPRRIQCGRRITEFPKHLRSQASPDIIEFSSNLHRASLAVDCVG